MEYPEWKMPTGMMPANPTAEEKHKWEMQPFVSVREFINELREYRKTLELKDNFLEMQKELSKWTKPNKKKGKTFLEMFDGYFIGYDWD